MNPKFFKSGSEFRKWLSKHHAAEKELLVGFYKKDSGKPSMTWPESVDAALCFGWIDGIRKRIDDESYSIRFTPRRKGSIWSRVNVDRVQVLSDLGLMQPAGLAAFALIDQEKSKIYSYEQRTATLDEPYHSLLSEDRVASTFFEAQAMSYRKAVCWWIMSAKQDETRHRRLQKLLESSREAKRLRQFTSPKPKS